MQKVLAQSSPTTRKAEGCFELEPSSSLDIRDEITLAAWVYMLGGGGIIVGKWENDLGLWSFVLNGPGDGFRLHWEDETQTNLTDFSVPFLQWSHYAGTYDGGYMRVYVNGTLVQEEQVAGKRINSTDQPVWIGDVWNTPGLIDAVQIWNVARTQAQIQHSMSNGLNGDEPGLVGWFPMDADPLIDRSQQGNHGRLEGEAVIHALDLPTDARHAPEQVLWLMPLTQ